MKSRTRTLHAIGKTMVVPVILVVFACVGLSRPSLAAEYCYRHIYNNTSCEFVYTICNNRKDCREYPVPPKSKVRIGIPDDRLYFWLRWEAEHMACPKKIAISMSGKNVTDLGLHGEWSGSCLIKGVGFPTTLDSYPQKAWLTFNEPANGDIQMNE